MNFSICQMSRRGGRKMNQDRAAYSVTPQALLMVLADGMGGHLRGEIAAQIAVEVMTGSFAREANPRVSAPAHFLASTMALASEAIFCYAGEKGMPEIPGTTCVACLVQDGTAWWAHAGDSRLYLMREGGLLFRTRDHSLVWELVERGLVSEEEAEMLPERSIIYNCLGASARLEVESGGEVALKESDTLLLCSDGLWSPLRTEEIVAVFRQPPQDALRTLMAEAESREGSASDNVTGIVAHYLGAAPGPAAGGSQAATFFAGLDG